MTKLLYKAVGMLVSVLGGCWQCDLREIGKFAAYEDEAPKTTTLRPALRPEGVAPSGSLADVSGLADVRGG